MKTVKFLSMTLLMSMLCAGMTYAQQQAQPGQPKMHGQNRQKAANVTPEQRATRQVEAMKQTLNLTPDQVTKLQDVQTKFAKDQEQLRASKQGARQDMKAKMDAYNSQVKSILTPEQYQKYQDMHKSGMKKGGQGKGFKKGNWNKTPKAGKLQQQEKQ